MTLKFKSFGERFAEDLLKRKKLEKEAKEQSTARLERIRKEALRHFKETQSEESAEKIRRIDLILDHNSARFKK